jgi:hypothetical protein
VSIAAGRRFMMARKADGRVYTWGAHRSNLAYPRTLGSITADKVYAFGECALTLRVNDGSNASTTPWPSPDSPSSDGDANTVSPPSPSTTVTDGGQAEPLAANEGDGGVGVVNGPAPSAPIDPPATASSQWGSNSDPLNPDDNRVGSTRGDPISTSSSSGSASAGTGGLGMPTIIILAASIGSALVIVVAAGLLMWRWQANRRVKAMRQALSYVEMGTDGLAPSQSKTLYVEDMAA